MLWSEFPDKLKQQLPKDLVGAGDLVIEQTTRIEGILHIKIYVKACICYVLLTQP